MKFIKLLIKRVLASFELKVVSKHSFVLDIRQIKTANYVWRQVERVSGVIIKEGRKVLKIIIHFRPVAC